MKSNKVVSLAPFLSLFFLFNSTSVFAQSATSTSVLSSFTLSLVTGLSLSILGFGLSMFAWRKEGKQPVSEDKQKRADKIGCVGLVIGGLGILCLVPLLFLLQSMMMTAIGFSVLALVTYVIYRILK